MKHQLLPRAHRLYELEGDHLLRLIENDPNFARLHKKLARLEARLSARLGSQEAKALTEGHRLMLEITRETAFKMGYLMAHTYPLDEVTRV